MIEISRYESLVVDVELPEKLSIAPDLNVMVSECENIFLHNRFMIGIN